MSDTKWFKDPLRVKSFLEGWSVDGAEFPAKNWSMEIVFTRKVKPVALGTVIICTSPSSPLRLAERQEDGWHNIYPVSDYVIWGGSLEEQDELARRCWRPITDAAWEDED